MTARHVRDENGVEWQVYEVVPPDELLNSKQSRHPLNLPAAWLCFESATQRRRLSPVPEDWREAPPEELRRLLRLAKGRGERGTQSPSP
jgi:hypothetical protein